MRQITAHPLPVVLTQLIESHDRKPGGTAQSDLQKDKSQRKRIIDAGHFFRTERSAADRRIAERIDLLQKIGQNDRDRKHDQDLDDISLCKVDRIEKSPQPKEKGRLFYWFFYG